MTLLESILDCLKNKPGLTAGKIASELSVTRHEINSLLYRNNKKLFTRIDNGEKAPNWILFSSVNDRDSNGTELKVQTNVENPGRAIVKKIVDSIDIEISRHKKFETRTGATRLEVVLVSEGVNSNFTRYEVLDIDDIIVIINEDSLVNDSYLGKEHSSIAFHILHCIADCLTQYKIRRTEVVEEEFIPTKNEIFLKLLSMSFEPILN